MIFWTIVFVSSSDPPSLMPATRIRLLRPYCSSESTERSEVKKTKMTGSQLPVKSPSNIQLVDVNVNRESC
jgi:hypothetical protein